MCGRNAQAPTARVSVKPTGQKRIETLRVDLGKEDTIEGILKLTAKRRTSSALQESPEPGDTRPRLAKPGSTD